MKNTVLKYGIIGGLIIVALTYIGFAIQGDSIDFKYGQLKGYASMIIALSTIFLGIKSYRDNSQAGIISFGKAFKIGILISLIASAFYIIAWMIYFGTESGQNFMAQYIQYSIQNLEASGASVAEVENFKTQMDNFSEMYKNPLVRIGFTFIEIFPVGLIISIISALILRKNPSNV